MDQRTLGRRDFLRLSALTAAGAALTGCAQATPQVIRETVEVPVERTVVVEETVMAPQATAPPPGPVTLTMMDWSPLSDELLALYKERHPNVTIAHVKPDDTRLRAMWAASTPPDFWNGGAHQVPQWVYSGWLLDLTPFFEISEVLKVDDMTWPCDFWRFDGSSIGAGPRYGIPSDWSPDFVAWINPDAFDEAGLEQPSTSEPLKYSDLPAIAQALTKKEGDRIVRIGAAFDYYPIEAVVGFRLAEDGEHLYSGNYRQIQLRDRPAVTEALRVFMDMWEAGSAWTPLNPSPSWSVGDYVGGSAGMTLFNSYWISGMVKDASSPMSGKGYMVPAPMWTSGRYDPPYGPAGTAVARITKSLDEAWAFYEFRNGQEPAIEKARGGGGLPSLKSLWQYIPAETEWDRKILDVVMAEAALPPLIRDVNPYYFSLSGWSDALTGNLEKALKGEITFEEMIGNMEDEINQLIADGLHGIGA